MFLKKCNIDITPDFPVFKIGDQVKPKEAGIVLNRLEINITYLKSNDIHLIFASFDILFVTRQIEIKFNQLVKEIFGESVSSILLATHTHYAPSVDERPQLGKYNPDYFAFVEVRIRNILIELKNQPFTKVKMSIQKANISSLISNRRRNIGLIKPKIEMEPAFWSKPNSNFTKITFEDELGNIQACWHHTSCHPTNLPFNENYISSEYIGYLRDVERRKIKNLTVVFFQGFSGDLRGAPPFKYLPLRLFWRLFKKSFPIKFYKMQLADYNKWLKSFESKINRLSEPIKLENISLIDFKTHKEDLSSLGLKSNHVEELSIKKVNLNDFNLFFVNAEVLSSYQEMIKETNGLDIFVAYEGNCFGYLPSDNEIREGGYEVIDFMDVFEVKGVWKSGNILEKIMKEL